MPIRLNWTKKNREIERNTDYHHEMHKIMFIRVYVEYTTHMGTNYNI